MDLPTTHLLPSTETVYNNTIYCLSSSTANNKIIPTHLLTAMKIALITMLLAAIGTLHAATMDMNIAREEQEQQLNERLLPRGDSTVPKALHVEPMSNPHANPSWDIEPMEGMDDEEKDNTDDDGTGKNAISKQPAAVIDKPLDALRDPYFPHVKWETRSQYAERIGNVPENPAEIGPKGRTTAARTTIAREAYNNEHDHSGKWIYHPSEKLRPFHDHAGTRLPRIFPDDDGFHDNFATLRRGMVTSPTANDGSVAQIITTHSDDFPRKVGETFTGTLKTRHSQFDPPEHPSEMPAWHDNGKTKHVAQYVGGLGHDGVPSGTGNFRGSAVDWHNDKLNKDPAPSSDIFHSDGDWKPVDYTGEWKDGESGAKRKRTTTAHSELTEASFARARRFAPPRARWAGLPHGSGTMKYDDPSTPGSTIELGPTEGTWNQGKFQRHGTDLMSYLRKDIVDHPRIPSLAGPGFDSQMWLDPPTDEEDERRHDEEAKKCCRVGAVLCACAGLGLGGAAVASVAGHASISPLSSTSAGLMGGGLMLTGKGMAQSGLGAQREPRNQG